MVDAMSRQFHAIMDKYIPYDMTVMDSVLRNQLSHRFIYHDFLCVEVVNSKDSVICSNAKFNGESGLDSYRYSINPDDGIYYRAYMTPLTNHILNICPVKHNLYVGPGKKEEVLTCRQS